MFGVLVLFYIAVECYQYKIYTMTFRLIDCLFAAV